MAFSVFGSSMGDCRVNISLVDPTVFVSSTENLLVEWGVGFTIDLPENLSPDFLLFGLLGLFGNLPCIHCHCHGLSHKAFDVHFGQSGQPNPLLPRLHAGM